MHIINDISIELDNIFIDGAKIKISAQETSQDEYNQLSASNAFKENTLYIVYPNEES